MKKLAHIILLIGIIHSCSKKTSISDINNYVDEIENRQDLKESVSHSEIENSNGESVGLKSIFKLTDRDNNLFRVYRSEINPNNTIMTSSIYFKNNKLVFARVTQTLDNWNELDTIASSEMYFENGRLISKIIKNASPIDEYSIKALADSLVSQRKGEIKDNVLQQHL